MKNKLLLVLFMGCFSSHHFSQDKILLLRFNETKKSVLNKTSDAYIEKGSVKKLGTIVLNSESVMIRYDDLSDGIKKYKIVEVKNVKNRKYYISENKKWIFALTKDNSFLTQIVEKDRFIYIVEDYKYVDE